jgi:hypothetical protein
MAKDDSTSSSPRYIVEQSKGASFRIVDTRTVKMRYGIPVFRIVCYVRTVQEAERLCAMLNQQGEKHTGPPPLHYFLTTY